MTPYVIGALVLVVVLALVVALGRRRRRDTDGVAMFQRQIDALSPEARRPVVDRVQQLDTTGDDAAKDGHLDHDPKDTA